MGSLAGRVSAIVETSVFLAAENGSIPVVSSIQ